MRTPVGNAPECEACNRKRAAALLGFPHRTVEIAPESMRFQEASIRVEEAVALKRLKRPLEVAFKSAQPNEWKNPLDQTQGVRLDPYQIGQRPLLVRASAE